jgi:hypothetical protein
MRRLERKGEERKLKEKKRKEPKEIPDLYQR